MLYFQKTLFCLIQFFISYSPTHKENGPPQLKIVFYGPLRDIAVSYLDEVDPSIRGTSFKVGDAERVPMVCLPNKT